MACRDNTLREFVARKVWTQDMVVGGACVGGRERKHKRSARVIVPDFNGIDVVPMAGGTIFEQEVNACASGAAFVFGNPSLAVIAPSGWGAKSRCAMISSAVI